MRQQSLGAMDRLECCVYTSEFSLFSLRSRDGLSVLKIFEANGKGTYTGALDNCQKKLALGSNF